MKPLQVWLPAFSGRSIGYDDVARDVQQVRQARGTRRRARHLIAWHGWRAISGQEPCTGYPIAPVPVEGDVQQAGSSLLGAARSG